VVIASDYPFLDVFWTMTIFFVWVIWLTLLFRVFADIFRRRDIGGGAKTLWLIFVIALPYLGVFVYLLTQSQGIAERSVKAPQTYQQ
jgi:phospholipase D-like protein